nr:hypothetical protein [Tanacetum cinerariifolium]
MHILNDLSFFLTNKTGARHGEELGLLKPLSKSSYSCSDNSFISDGANRYGARAMGAAHRFKSIWNSTGQAGGRPDKSSGNTSGKSQTIGKVSYLVALVVFLSTRAIVMKMALDALGQVFLIWFLFTRSHIVDLGDILPLGRESLPSVPDAYVVSGMPGAKTRVYTPAHGGSKAQNGLPDSILSTSSVTLVLTSPKVMGAISGTASAGSTQVIPRPLVGLAGELSPISYLDPIVDKQLLQGGISGISSLRSIGGGMYRGSGSGGDGGGDGYADGAMHLARRSPT